MNKYEFVDELNMHLKGKIDQRELEDTIRYYQDYIDMEIRKGKSEAEVIEELPAPRLLAKNIADTKGYANETEWQSTYQEEDDGKYKKNRWIRRIVVLLVVCLVISILFKILAFLLPIVCILLIVGAVYRWIQKLSR